jgi:hypothetical protein
MGLHGARVPILEQDPVRVLDELVRHRLGKEKLPAPLDALLIKVGDNSRGRQHQAEIQAEVLAGYSEEEEVSAGSLMTRALMESLRHQARPHASSRPHEDAMSESPIWARPISGSDEERLNPRGRTTVSAAGAGTPRRAPAMAMIR